MFSFDSPPSCHSHWPNREKLNQHFSLSLSVSSIFSFYYLYLSHPCFSMSWREWCMKGLSSKSLSSKESRRQHRLKFLQTFLYRLNAYALYKSTKKIIASFQEVHEDGTGDIATTTCFVVVNVNALKLGIGVTTVSCHVIKGKRTIMI